MLTLLLLCAVLSSAGALDYSWRRLHLCADPDRLRETVDDYRHRFPCLDCRAHFETLLQHHPFPLKLVRTPRDAQIWTWFTHNLVNLRLDKPWRGWDIMDTYTNRTCAAP